MFTDESGSLASAKIDYNYKRAVTWSTASTPTALWTFGVAPYLGGIMTVSVSGTHTNTGGFVCVQKIAYTVDGSGAVTIVTLESITQGSAGPQVTFQAGTNQIVARLATSDSQSIAHGVASLNVDGKLTQLKVGA